MAYTRAQFRAIIRQRLGWSATDTFVTDAELNSYLTDSLSELNSLLVTVYRPGQFGAVLTGLVILANSTSSPLSTFGDFGRLIKVTLFYGQDDVPLQPGDRTVDITTRTAVPWTPWNVRYFLSVDGQNSALMFSRPPSVDTTVLVTYIRTGPAMANETDTSWMGWDEYAVLDVCIKCRVKEEADTSDLESQKSQLQARIRAQADPLDMGRAATVQDLRSLEDYRNNDASWWRR